MSCVIMSSLMSLVISHSIVISRHFGCRLSVGVRVFIVVSAAVNALPDNVVLCVTTITAAEMEQYLKPVRFDGGQSSEWLHWQKTFENFVGVISKKDTVDKLQVLINYVTSNVYQHISECKTYDEAVKSLEAIFVRPKNEIFARHTLLSRKQGDNESVSDYVQILKQLAKDCQFVAVSEEESRNDYIRDSFISGISSHEIRQRLLESPNLSLVDAERQALALECAQRNAASYKLGIQVTHPIAAMNSQESDEVNIKTIQDNFSDNSSIRNHCAAIKNKSCFFCGNSVHARLNCPARNATCKKCLKTGHFARVCRSSVSSKCGICRKAGHTSSACYSSTNRVACISSTLAAIQAKMSHDSTTIAVRINGTTESQALIDIGSSKNFVSLAFFKQLKIYSKPCNITISLASSSIIDVNKYCVLNLQIGGVAYDNIPFYIMDNLCSPMVL